MTRAFRTVLFTIIFFAGLGATPAAADISLDSTVGVKTQYVGMSGMQIYDKPVVQGDFFWTFPSGFWADACWSTDPNFRENYGREIDWAAGWSGKYWNLGAWYFDFTQQFSLKPVGDYVDAVGEGFYPIRIVERHEIAPRVKGDVFYSTFKPRDWSGAFFQVGLSHTWEARSWLEFEQVLNLVYDSGIFGYDSGFVARYDSQFAWKLESDTVLNAPAIRTTVPVSGVEGRRAQVAFGASFTFTSTLLNDEEE